MFLHFSLMAQNECISQARDEVPAVLGRASRRGVQSCRVTTLCSRHNMYEEHVNDNRPTPVQGCSRKYELCTTIMGCRLPCARHGLFMALTAARIAWD